MASRSVWKGKLALERGEWPLSKGSLGSLVVVGLLFLCAYALKALGRRRLFPADERPQPIALAAAGLALPRPAARRQLVRFRLGRWLRPGTTSMRAALPAWTLVSASRLIGAVALFLLLGTVGIGFSFPLALLFLSAGAAGAALPIGPGGAATQAGAGAAVLVAAGVGASEASGVALAARAPGVLTGGAIFLGATASRTGLRLASAGA